MSLLLLFRPSAPAAPATIITLVGSISVLPYYRAVHEYSAVLASTPRVISQLRGTPDIDPDT